MWCWDVTWLASRVTGRWFYLCLILDLYSRKIVGHEVHEVGSGDHAAQLLKRTTLSEGVHAAAHKPVLHGDNGASLKATTVLAMLHWLGIAPSYSRPRVSDDNAFVESLFRTAKYRHGYPQRASRISTMPDAGRQTSFTGTTPITATAVSASSPQLNDTRPSITRYCSRAMRYTKPPATGVRDGGV